MTLPDALQRRLLVRLTLSGGQGDQILRLGLLALDRVALDRDPAVDRRYLSDVGRAL